MTEPVKHKPDKPIDIVPLEPNESQLLGGLTRRLGSETVAKAAGVGVSSVWRAVAGERLRPSVRTAIRAYVSRLAAA